MIIEASEIMMGKFLHKYCYAHYEFLNRQIGGSMRRVEAEPMPGNPAAKRVGDKSGLWRVLIYFPNTIIEPEVHAENLSYEDARDLAEKLKRQLNEDR